ncbi:YcaO-like family protein [Streptomyces sp. NPDC006285]|uniref:YcaO-like family protein n=1 Tax=Streptomyces sp. NPDC006285 TaxID=3364742 RepID=UPI0036BAB186
MMHATRGLSPSGQVDLDTKVLLDGTHRARQAQQTWEIIKPLLPRYGVTRVADLSGLDCIGIPVFAAMRPLSETLAVSQGKGASPILAKVSAAMECIELQHAERPNVPSITGGTQLIAEHYPIESLPIRVDPRTFDNISLDWYLGTGLLSGQKIPVPALLVINSWATGHDWKPNLFNVGSNGLASGNTVTEAALHALYEVIERDVVSTLHEGGNDVRIHIDPKSIPSGHCSEFVRKLDAAGVELELAMIPNRFGIATAAAFIWSHEYPAVCAGSGSHSDPLVAVSRAISEAVQSRLTHISGTRDDIESYLDAFDVQRDSPGLRTTGMSWHQAVEGMGFAETSLSRELDRVAHLVKGNSGYEPIMVDLSSQPDVFSVCKVVCPGLGHQHRGYVPR